MAFFNDIGKTLTQAGQAAVHKTKEVADITKANTKVLDAQNKLDKAYAEAGRKYAQLHAGNPEDGMKEAMAVVHEMEERLRELQKELYDLKGMAECPECGTMCEGKSAFCPKCGATLPKNASAIDAE